MSIQAWNTIKSSKFFYVKTYRQLSTMLFISLVVNVILGVLVYFSYINLPARDFYSTNGITPPAKLTPMLTPNRSSQALLAPDPEINDNQVKVIPQ